MAEQLIGESTYKLRCTLLGHSSDVRAVAVSDGDIVTASRDQTSKLWRLNSTSGNYEEKITYVGHTGYVTSICLISDSSQSSTDGLTVTGSKDSTILVFPRLTAEPIHTLSGHTDTVSCLAFDKEHLISGSWDHTIRIWKNWECVGILEGHSGPIWSVATLCSEDCQSPCLISASADKTLRYWKNNKVVVTYSGHTDCVRGVTIVDNDKFISCSNDASLRLWCVSGACLATFYGHTNFVYSVSRLGLSGGFISGGEDRSVRVWDSQGNNISSIYLPAQSIWSVCSFSDSDIVVGSSDGICRIFSRDPSRQATGEELALFEKSLSEFKVAVEDVGGIKKSDLPDKTILLTPGKRDGQTIMVRDGDKVLCYNWSVSKNEWEAVGEVVGGTGGSASSSGKVLFEGREYDYVFDVDLDENKIIKLPYNKGEDPWHVAQSFIHRHELPQVYLDVVAKFIIKNANVSGQSYASAGSYDPFTGGSRYIPSGGNSYQNGSVSNHGNQAPVYNGSARNISSPYFPQAFPLKFDNINKEGMKSKLEESNKLVESSLSDEEIEKLLDTVVSQDVLVSNLAPLEKALKWPCERVWPVLDVLRLAVRSEIAQKEWLTASKGPVVVDLLTQLLLPPSCIPTQLLSLRCLANLALHQPGQKSLSQCAKSVIAAAVTIAPYPNKNIEIAAATLFINLSIILNDSTDIENQCQVLSGAATVALTASDFEAQFRILVALGTLLSRGCKNMASLANSLDIKPIVEKFALLEEPRKVGECARHLLHLL